MSNNGIARVHYFERQVLRTQDFTDEQAYHVAMRRRHNIAHHTWGIVRGLELVVEEGNLFVQPGMAVDGYGRELILPERQPLPTGAFADKGSNVLDVWLVYDRVGSDRAPKGYAGCGDGADVPFHRWQERPLIRLDVPDPAFPDRRRPESVHEGDLDFDPSRTPPDDPQEDWPVFLGQIIRDPTNPNQPYTVDLADRPYVGLVGEGVVAPSGRARVQIGAELESDPRRFAVFVPEADPKPNAPPRLEIYKDGEVAIRGNATLYGDLKVEGGAIEFGVGTVTSRQPWRIYHNLEDSKHELRIEMAGETGGLNQVVIGVWSAEEKKFKPCLTVADDCTVTVHGNLVVEGQIDPQADRVAAPLSPEARRLIQTVFLSGIGGANLLLERFYRSPFPPKPEAVTPMAMMMMAPEAAMRVVAKSLAADPTRLAAFADLIESDHPDLAASLRAAREEGEG